MIGAPNSSNSMRLVEVAERAGCARSFLVQRADDIDWNALQGVASVGVTAGASAPEILVDEVISAFKSRYAVTVKPVTVSRERVQFKLPRALSEQA